MTLTPQTDQSLRNLAVFGLRHLRRFHLFNYDTRIMSDDELEAIGRCAVEAIENFLTKNHSVIAFESNIPHAKNSDDSFEPLRQKFFEK